MSDPGSPDDAESFVSNLPLTRIFGTHPKTRIVGAMLAEDQDPPTAFSHNEVARIAGLDEATVRDHVADLRSIGVVVDTEEAEGLPDDLEGETYTLDESRDVVADVRRLNDDAAELVFGPGK